jgi:hypothetical protein
MDNHRSTIDTSSLHDLHKDAGLIEFFTQKKGKEGFWETIDIMMRYFYSGKNPTALEEIRAIENEVKLSREVSMNKFNATKDMSARRLGLIPTRIYVALKRIYGGSHNLPMPEREFQHKFFRKYPQFRISEKI